MKPLVIGISGVTCGGKTTLSNKLKEKFPEAILIHQDDYFYPEDSDKHVYLEDLQHANWDTLSSLDMNGLYEKVKSLLTKSYISKEKFPTLVIIDGHLILNDKRIEELCDKKYYFILPQDECWNRRSKRTYQPPDPPGYFDKCIWPMHEQYHQMLKESIQDLIYLDGMKDEEEIFNYVLQDIELVLYQSRNTSTSS